MGIFRALLILSIFFLIFLSLYLLLSILSKVTYSKNVGRYMKDSVSAQKTTKSFSSGIVKFVAGKIKLDKDKKNRLEGDLKKVGLEVTAEVFVARGIVNMIGPLLLIPIIATIAHGIGSIIIIIILIAISSLLYVKNNQSINKMLQEVKEKITDELPRFVGNFRYSFDNNRDYVSIIEKYRKLCSPAFEYDLEVLLVDLKTIDQADAFKRFSDRVGIDELTTFVSGLIGLTKGVDFKSFFAIVQKDMKTLKRKKLIREKNKTPKKINFWAGVNAVMTLVLLLAPFFYMMYQNYILIKKG